MGGFLSLVGPKRKGKVLSIDLQNEERLEELGIYSGSMARELAVIEQLTGMTVTKNEITQVVAIFDEISIGSGPPGTSVWQRYVSYLYSLT